MDIEYISEDGFSRIYKATLEKNSNRQKSHIVLKVLNNSKNADTKFLNELRSKFVVKCYEATQDPKTKNHAFIFGLCTKRRFTQILKSYVEKKDRDIIIGIKFLHDNKIVHRDLHSAVISDLGFSQRVTVDSKNSKKTQTYKVIPYMAPELFKDEPYTFASDVHGLGRRKLRMGGISHFIIEKMDGKRPEITWENLMKKCCHPDPSQLIILIL
ncbi:hypothetical protein Glove_368g44 [Diversispora epigaea]|uniref:non-specific serine/threonine protein kinase n=1 Tax=Diversispora epigaea TaxID=1348612 RepID=A0A397H717_9GLOM|nr:hypothetical protein Glove_368g44 [Diversispora epigaea]